MFKNYLLVALRKLKRNKVITAINVFGLAVSMSVCMLLILIIADQYAYDNFHAHSDRIFRVNTDRVSGPDNTWSTASTAFPLGEYLTDHDAVETKVTIRSGFSGTANWQESEIPFRGFMTENSFFDIFNFPLKSGDSRTALSNPNSIVLTEPLAEKIFGDKDPLGEVIEMDEYGPLTVTGVMVEFPGKSHMHFEALTSIQLLPSLISEGKIKTPLTDWTNIYNNYQYIRMKEGRSAKELEELFATLSESHYEEEDGLSYYFKTQALNSITPGPQLSNSPGFGIPQTFIYIMIAIAMVVLISACINYSNLTTAHNLGKAREMGIRKVVGAKRRTIIYQVMVESMVISTVSFLLAFVVFSVLHPQFNQMIVSAGAPVTFDGTPGIWMWFFGFMLFTGVIAGIVPSLFFSATQPLNALKKQVDIKNMGRWFSGGKLPIRKFLFVFQFAFSVFFVITIMALYQQMNMVYETDHGFETKDMVHIRLQGMEYESLMSDIQKQASVRSVSPTSHIPATGTNYTALVKMKAEDEPRSISYFSVGHDYVDVMGLELLSGKTFSKEVTSEESSIIINEVAIKKFGLGSPEAAIGEIMMVDDNPLRVIGVVKDFHFERLDEEIKAMALRYKPENMYSLIVALQPQVDKSEALAQLQSTWESHTNRPFEYTYFEDEMRFSYLHFELLIKMLGYVTILVISIACLGLLGMVIFTINNKRREIGIRKVFGAESKNILFVIGKRFIGLITLSYLVGGPIAYFFNTFWLETYAYRIDFGWGALLIGFIILLSVVMLTVGSQLYRAVHINPSESLRVE